MKIAIRSALFLCVMMFGANTAFGTAFGLRAGYGVDPDQGVVGLQLELSGKKLEAFRLAPSVDFGFGDNITTVSANMDFLAKIKLPASESSLYAGFGPTFTYWDFDQIDNDLEIGLSLVGGARFPMGRRNVYNAELRFGVGDIPEIRILFGVLFGARPAPARTR